MGCGHASQGVDDYQKGSEAREEVERKLREELAAAVAAEANSTRRTAELASVLRAKGLLPDVGEP